MQERNQEGGWDFRRTSLSYMVLAALEEQYPQEADHWLGVQRRFNARTDMPVRHGGGKAYSWIVAALNHDAYAWGATWADGVLHVRPKQVLLEDPRAPKAATIYTPEGPVELVYQNGGVSVANPIDVSLEVYDSSGQRSRRQP